MVENGFGLVCQQFEPSNYNSQVSDLREPNEMVCHVCCWYFGSEPFSA
jgi:hypothetical protein